MGRKPVIWDIYHDEDKDYVDNPTERLQPPGPSLLLAYTSIKRKLAIEKAVNNKKDHDAAKLDANANHINMLPQFRCICVVRGEHAPTSSLDDEAHDIEDDENFGEPLCGDAGHAALRNDEMDKTGDYHVYECINP